MLAVVMDGGSHIKRPWDNEQTYRSADNRHGMQPATDPAGARSNPHQLHGMPSPSHMLPPIVTAAEQPLRPLQIERMSAAPPLAAAPQHHSHSESPQDMASKRPRLYYDTPHQPDLGRNPPPGHGPPANMPLTGHDRHDQQWSGWEPRFPEGIYPPRDTCQNCVDSKGLVEKVVSGLERLEAELRQVLACSPLGRTLKEVSQFSSETRQENLICFQENTELLGGPNVSDAGMKESLVWASRSVEASTRIIREFAASQRALPRISVANLGLGPAHEQPSAITSAPPDYSRGFTDKADRERQKDGQRRYGPPYRSDYQHRGPDSAQPQSPHPTPSSGSVYASSHSPMGMGASGRLLPSPSSVHNAPSLASVQAGYSPNSNQSAHSTHLQDLQHQISTKSLALTTLQREHDQLLAAYSRMQIRCQTLDKKSQVSDHEINTLTDEKVRLQSQVEAFDVQVEELVKARDEAQKQTTANGAQYMRIMSMSSKLQFQGAEEAKRYKLDREAWERDREGLERRIEELEVKDPNLTIPGGAKADHRTSTSPEDVLASASLDVLRNEIVRLRQSLLSTERMIGDLQLESQKIDHVITECTGIRERLTAKTTLPGQQLTVALPPETFAEEAERESEILMEVAEVAAAVLEEERKEAAATATSTTLTTSTMATATEPANPTSFS
jgi:hypothetical protein